MDWVLSVAIGFVFGLGLVRLVELIIKLVRLVAKTIKRMKRKNA